jgi:FrmR/RcnR family transcriptional regulator, repressor of rcnA expression
MPHTIREKTALLARIRRIKGQAEAIEKALAQEAEASSVLQQIAAIRGATNGLMSEVLEGHLREHVVAAASAKEREREVEAIVRILRTYLK